MTLDPGDVILTGTPEGVGPMRPGDTIEIEIGGVGVLRNPVEGPLGSEKVDGAGPVVCHGRPLSPCPHSAGCAEWCRRRPMRVADHT